MKTKLSESGEWETPLDLYTNLCNKYKIHPYLDVAANKKNSLCRWYHTNALETDWIIHDELEVPVQDIWCNPPHSKNEEFVKKAYGEWSKYNMNIMMILPANAICTNYAEDFILDYAEYYPINRSYCRFRHKGKETAGSRNGYFVVIWRRIEN